MSGRRLTLYCEVIPSPIGEVLLLTDGSGALRAVEFADQAYRAEDLLNRYYGSGCWQALDAAKKSDAASALTAWFAGHIGALDRIPTVTGGTDFQRSVWSALGTTKPGETLSYSELAERIEQPGASRAVGMANGANPIMIAVPCHRIIGADGKLTGYAGGLKRKKWLLEHEARHAGLSLAA